MLLTLLVSLVCGRAHADRSLWSARATHLSVPYGLRVPDSYLFARDLTRGERVQSMGADRLLPCSALSVRLDPLAEVRAQKSTPDPFRERGYMVFVQYALSTYLEVGASGRLTVADADRTYLQRLGTTRVAASAFTRLRLARAFAIAAEVGAYDNSRRELGYGAALQLDLTLLEGLRLLGTFGAVERGARTEEANVGPVQADLQPGGWVTLDWLVNRRFETRLDAIHRESSGTSLLARFTTYF